MFGYLYNNIFPYVLDFFSKLVGLASMPVGDFITQMAGLGNIPYTNLITGVTDYYTLFALWTPAQPILAGIFSIMFGGVPSTAPLWVGMLLCCIEIYFCVAVIKFVAGLF